MFELQPSHASHFVLHLLPRNEGVTVRANGPAGEPVESHTHLQRIEDVLRMVSQPGFHEDVGRGLFRALFSGEIETAYRAAYTQATLDGVPLTLELHLAHDVLRLARYPWELIHDGTRFAVQSGIVNLVRTLDFPEAVPPYTPRGPVDVLVAAAQPDDQPGLASVYDALDEALADYVSADTLDLAALFPPTWDSLMDWLLAGAPDVLHFEGYGDFTRTGRLFFEGDRGSDPVDAAGLGAAFYSTRLRLIALSASVERANGDESLLSSIAPTLIEAGIPAVVAVQRTLPVESAARFWSTFYRAILDGESVEGAVLMARQQLRRTTDWPAITLYRRAAQVPAADATPAPVRLDTAAPEQAAIGWTVRAAMWVQRPAVPAPAPYIVHRLIGAQPPQDEFETVSLMQRGERGTVSLHAGAITVRLSAPGCVVHNRGQHTRMFSPAVETPPLWFALTPRESGDVMLTFELLQDEHVVATVHHPLRIVGEIEAGGLDDDAAVVRTHFAGEGVAAGGRVLAGMPPATDQRESHEQGHDPGRESAFEDRTRREPRHVPVPDALFDAPPDVSREDVAFDEALDGVLDMLQAGMPPDDEDDPLVRTPLPTVPEPRSVQDEPTQLDGIAALEKARRGWPAASPPTRTAVPPFEPAIDDLSAAQQGRVARRRRLLILVLVLALVVVIGMVLAFVVL